MVIILLDYSFHARQNTVIEAEGLLRTSASFSTSLFILLAMSKTPNRELALTLHTQFRY